MQYIGTNRFETERLILRKITIDDVDQAFLSWCGKDNVSLYVLWKKHEDVTVTLEQYRNWILEYDDPRTFRWIVELKENSEVIGTIDVSKKFLNFGTCQVGYCYGDQFWNKGYATEALRGVIKYLFERAEAELVCAEYMSLNPASGRVMEKAGMNYDGVLRGRVIDKHNRRNDLVAYSITRDEYFKESL